MSYTLLCIAQADCPQLNRDLFDQHCPPQLSQVVAGMAKVFVADVIEMGKLFQDPHNWYGSITAY